MADGHPQFCHGERASPHRLEEVESESRRQNRSMSASVPDRIDQSHALLLIDWHRRPRCSRCWTGGQLLVRNGVRQAVEAPCARVALQLSKDDAAMLGTWDGVRMGVGMRAGGCGDAGVRRGSQNSERSDSLAAFPLGPPVVSPAGCDILLPFGVFGGQIAANGLVFVNCFWYF